MSARKDKAKLTLAESVVFAMLGALMFGLKVAMQSLPNIHPVGMLTMVYTVAYRKKALYPLYIYVLLDGLFGGFSLWWIPYLYIWTVLWGVVMLLPRNMPDKAAAFVYPVICALHGIAFGTLYAPAQALMFHLSFKQMLAWIAAGLPFDAMHSAGNFAAGLLVLPLSKLLKKISETKMQL